MPQLDLHEGVRRKSGLFHHRGGRGNVRKRSCRRLQVERLERRDLLAFDPSGQAQEMLEQINRMRMDPQGELSVLFSSLNPLNARDPGAAVGIHYCNDPTTDEIQSEWAALEPVAPLAWHEALYKAAVAHSQMMIQNEQQSHHLPGEADFANRITNAGYPRPICAGENIFAYAADVFNGHSAFAIDWGVSSRGHRDNLMDAAYREVGIGIVVETSGTSAVGPLVITEDFGNRGNYGNAYLLGVLYSDANDNQSYDAGEGVAGANIEVTGSGGTFTTTTMTAGGYQLKVPPGTYTVTASGGGLTASQQHGNVSVGNANVKVDFDGRDPTVPKVPSDPTVPTVVSVTASSGVIAHGTVGKGKFSLTVVYSEPMNQTTKPAIAFPAENPGRTLTLRTSESRWINATTYVAKYDVKDVNTLLADVDVRVTGGVSVAGQTQVPSATANVFSIDTQNPSVTSITPNVSLLSEVHVGTGTFTLTVQFNEPMQVAVPPKLTFPRENPSSSVKWNAARSGWLSDTTYVAVYDVKDPNKALAKVDVAVAGARDAAGNPQINAKAADMFSIDTANPTVRSVTASPRKIADATVGAAAFSLTVVYSEVMNMTVAPVLSFPVENPGSRLTLNAGQSDWINSTTYVAKYDVASAKSTLANVDVSVTGARDAAGNWQTPAKLTNKFGIDIRNQPSSIAAVRSASLAAVPAASQAVGLTRAATQSGSFTGATSPRPASVSAAVPRRPLEPLAVDRLDLPAVVAEVLDSLP